jgi:hypothetical protein
LRRGIEARCRADERERERQAREQR